MEVLPHLKKFVQGNKFKIKKGFEDTIEKMKKKAGKNELRKMFIEEMKMDFDQFNDIVEFVFVVMLVEALLKLAKEGKDVEVVSLTWYKLILEMSSDAQNSKYEELIERAIQSCQEGVMFAYANIK